MKKKNMALGSLLLAVAVTGSLVCGTYAKYTSTIGAEYNEVRVAKWGIGNKYNLDLFADSYKNANKNTDVEAYNKSANNALTPSQKGDLLVAPGTSGVYAFNLGEVAPETNYYLDVNVTSTDNVNIYTKEDSTTDNRQIIKYYLYRVDSTAYEDLAADYTLADLKASGATELYAGYEIGNYTTGGTTNSTTGLAKTIADQFNTTTVIGANQTYATAGGTDFSDVYVIAWEWPMDADTTGITDDDAKKQAITTKDGKDTELGNGDKTTLTEANGDITKLYDELAKINLKVGITATQTEADAGSTVTR